MDKRYPPMCVDAAAAGLTSEYGQSRFGLANDASARDRDDAFSKRRHTADTTGPYQSVHLKPLCERYRPVHHPLAMSEWRTALFKPSKCNAVLPVHANCSVGQGVAANPSRRPRHAAA